MLGMVLILFNRAAFAAAAVLMDRLIGRMEQVTGESVITGDAWGDLKESW